MIFFVWIIAFVVLFLATSTKKEPWPDPPSYAQITKLGCVVDEHFDPLIVTAPNVALPRHYWSYTPYTLVGETRWNGPNKTWRDTRLKSLKDCDSWLKWITPRLRRYEGMK